MKIEDGVVAVPVTRDKMIKEYADGDQTYRFIVARDDKPYFDEHFRDIGQAVFIACELGAVEAVRDTLGGEYSNGDQAVVIRLDPANKQQFRNLFPDPKMPAFLFAEDPARGRQAMRDSMAEPKPLYGSQARILRVHLAFMNNPKVWENVGSDEDYLAYIRTMPCAHCKWQPRVELDTNVSCEAAHVRRVADGAGTGIKPKYSAIPLCPTRGEVEGCHARQHRQGESSLFGSKEVVDKLRIKYVNLWVWESLKDQLGYAHWNEVPPDTLLAWAKEHDLVDCLPECYR